MIRLKRVYEKPSQSDGLRILVERLWPRGLSKQAANIDLWIRDIAPSTELRKWFNHDPAKWDAFQRRYSAELRRNAAPLKNLKGKIKGRTVTFLFAARDVQHNSAKVLKRVLIKHRVTKEEQ